ncbi:MAG: hypothetical protein ACJAVV_000321 [Alphaproteobacteria bacterium]|jgi:hypothetical protein
MVTKRRENGFNLAFLDVMACGLGAVLLILIIVNFNDDTPIPSDEIEKLEQELAATENKSQSVATSLSKQELEISTEQANATEQGERIAQLSIQQKALQQAIAEKKAVLAELEDAVAAIASETADDTIELPSINEETYLLGLIVEGRRIGILVDTSASMTDESLIDIIKRKLSSDAVKKAGPKWQRTLRIIKWMLSRLPDSSQVAVVSFNNKGSALGSQAVTSAKVSTNIQKLVADVNALVPQNGTNLQEGLAELQRAMPDMTDLYIITDGLPSLISASSGFSSSPGCNPLPGKQATISGACRVQVMQRTLNVNKLSGVRTNVILLPLEGDPQASALYWQWTSFTGGTFISPAGTWP